MRVLYGENKKSRDGEREYNYLVRVKTSITLPEELLRRLDRIDTNRSSMLERAAVAYLARLERQARDKKDIDIINRNATRLNREARDTLGYQRLP
jgi:metal-responsive CopG/Arc/MetJ family transcriptional regulator